MSPHGSLSAVGAPAQFLTSSRRYRNLSSERLRTIDVRPSPAEWHPTDNIGRVVSENSPDPSGAEDGRYTDLSAPQPDYTQWANDVAKQTANFKAVERGGAPMAEEYDQRGYVARQFWTPREHHHECPAPPVCATPVRCRPGRQRAHTSRGRTASHRATTTTRDDGDDGPGDAAGFIRAGTYARSIVRRLRGEIVDIEREREARHRRRFEDLSREIREVLETTR